MEVAAATVAEVAPAATAAATAVGTGGSPRPHCPVLGSACPLRAGRVGLRPAGPGGSRSWAGEALGFRGQSQAGDFSLPWHRRPLDFSPRVTEHGGYSCLLAACVYSPFASAHRVRERRGHEKIGLQALPFLFFRYVFL